MKVRVRWTYAYLKEQTFEVVVDVPDAVTDEDEARELAEDAALSVDNGELKAINTTYPGDPCDAIQQVDIVAPDTPADIRAVPDGEPEFIEP